MVNSEEQTENGVVPITSGHSARGVEHVTQHELFTFSPWYILSDRVCLYCTTDINSETGAATICNVSLYLHYI